MRWGRGAAKDRDAAEPRGGRSTHLTPLCSVPQYRSILYLSGRNAVPGQSPRTTSWARVAPNVILLGLVSLFTDISSEMVNAVLPLYLTMILRFTPLQFGFVDGLQHGVTALLRTASGVAADKGQRHKGIAATGYGLAAVGKAVLLVAGTAPVVVALVLDRIGKGIRTAPRDALISHSTAPGRIAEAFGVHRTLDTAGALLGPVLAFLLLALVPGRFDAIFVTSLSAAVIGLAVLFLFVENRRAPGAQLGAAGATARAALGLLGRSGFGVLVVAGAVLSLATISDNFVYLTFQRRSDLDPRFFPLLYVGTALVYLLLAVPAGRAADRIGHRWIYLAGYLLLLAAYLVLLVPAPGLMELAGCLTLLGAYYAATDGVLMALASTMLPRPLVATGLSLLTTATALMRFAGAVAFGALWGWRGPEAAVLVFAVALGVAIVAAGALVPRAGRIATP